MKFDPTIASVPKPNPDESPMTELQLLTAIHALLQQMYYRLFEQYQTVTVVSAEAQVPAAQVSSAAD